MTGPRPGLVRPPAAAQLIFADRLPLAEQYAQLLAGDGVAHGLLGPREVPRLWERHLLNCALVGDLLPRGAAVVDVGSGAGLPGLALAVRRPDLRVALVEPMLRRTRFLETAVRELGLGDTVRVVRGRAEEPGVRSAAGDVSWVVARAVAPLARLAQWCVPLLVPGGRLLAMKGRSAAEEVAAYRMATPAGREEIELVELGGGLTEEVVRVVVLTVSARAKPRKGRR